jgi:hypothetical protein
MAAFPRGNSQVGVFGTTVAVTVAVLVKRIWDEVETISEESSAK